MKINVRNEPATAADEPPGSGASPDRTCVWVEGDDGSSISTKYLEPGQKLTIDIDATAAAATGEPEPL